MIPQTPTCRERLESIKKAFETCKRVSVIYACKRLSEDTLALIQDFPERESDINKVFCELVCGAL